MGGNVNQFAYFKFGNYTEMFSVCFDKFLKNQLVYFNFYCIIM